MLPQLLTSLGIYRGWQFVSSLAFERPSIWITHVAIWTFVVFPDIRATRTAVGFWAAGHLHAGSLAQPLPPALRRRLLRSLTNSQLVYVPSCALVLSCSFCASFVVPVGARLFCVVRVPPIPLALSSRIR